MLSSYDRSVNIYLPMEWLQWNPTGTQVTHLSSLARGLGAESDRPPSIDEHCQENHHTETESIELLGTSRNIRN